MDEPRNLLGNATVSEKVSEINDYLYGITEELERLEKNVNFLQDRIASVLAPTTPTDQAETAQKMPLSQLGSKLQSQMLWLRALNDKINDTNTRVQL